MNFKIEEFNFSVNIASISRTLDPLLANALISYLPENINELITLIILLVNAKAEEKVSVSVF